MQVICMLVINQRLWHYFNFKKSKTRDQDLVSILNKETCTDRFSMREISSLNTTPHTFQVSKRGWGVEECAGSAGNANEWLTHAKREYPKHQQDKNLSESEEEKVRCK